MDCRSAGSDAPGGETLSRLGPVGKLAAISRRLPESVRHFNLDLDLGRMKTHRRYLADALAEGWNFAALYLTLMKSRQA